MKKVFLLTMSALLVTGATFAEGTQKKCCKKSSKSCCKKGKTKTAAKEQTTKM